MDDEKTALDKFFRASYNALLELCSTNINHFEDEPLNPMTYTISHAAESLLSNAEFPEYLRLRVLRIVANVLGDKPRRPGSWVNTTGAGLSTSVSWTCGSPSMESMQTESEWDIVDEVDAQSDWTEDDIESIFTSGSDKSSTESGKPTVPPKSPELYERFPVSKHDNITT
ncbi:hypothetical protein D6C92_10617 [Aureobasidium pullulans]|nr:hypothetical protein D6C92_10617 [Aureobasidium pullulans]